MENTYSALIQPPPLPRRTRYRGGWQWKTQRRLKHALRPRDRRLQSSQHHSAFIHHLKITRVSPRWTQCSELPRQIPRSRYYSFRVTVWLDCAHPAYSFEQGSGRSERQRLEGRTHIEASWFILNSTWKRFDSTYIVPEYNILVMQHIEKSLLREFFILVVSRTT